MRGRHALVAKRWSLTLGDPFTLVLLRVQKFRRRQRRHRRRRRSPTFFPHRPPRRPLLRRFTRALAVAVAARAANRPARGSASAIPTSDAQRALRTSPSIRRQALIGVTTGSATPHSTRSDAHPPQGASPARRVRREVARRDARRVISRSAASRPPPRFRRHRRRRRGLPRRLRRRVRSEVRRPRQSRGDGDATKSKDASATHPRERGGRVNYSPKSSRSSQCLTPLFRIRPGLCEPRHRARGVRAVVDEGVRATELDPRAPQASRGGTYRHGSRGGDLYLCPGRHKRVGATRRRLRLRLRLSRNRSLRPVSTRRHRRTVRFAHARTPESATYIRAQKSRRSPRRTSWCHRICRSVRLSVKSAAIVISTPVSSSSRTSTYRERASWLLLESSTYR